MEAELTELNSMTLAESRDALRSRRLFSVELTEAHLRAMERAKGLNAFVATTPERALEMARASDARLAEGAAGPLEGLPIGVKDLYATKGVHTQACSHILDRFKPPYESTVTAHLWRDGAVMLGKLNMDEFRDGLVDRNLHLRSGGLALAAAELERREGARGARRRQARPHDARRFVGRLGGGGGGAPVSGGDGE